MFMTFYDVMMSLLLGLTKPLAWI